MIKWWSWWRSFATSLVSCLLWVTMWDTHCVHCITRWSQWSDHDHGDNGHKVDIDNNGRHWIHLTSMKIMICQTLNVSLWSWSCYVRQLWSWQHDNMTDALVCSYMYLGMTTAMMITCRTPWCVLICPRACPTVHSLPSLSRAILAFCLFIRVYFYLGICVSVSVFVFMHLRVFVFVFVFCTCVVPSLSPAILSFCILIQPPILSLCAFVCEQPGLICHISALVQQFISYFESFFLVANIWRRHY